MLLIPCPHCGPRPEIEFRHAGEAHLTRPAAAEVSDAGWADFLYMRTNPKGIFVERWRHIHGCGRYLNCVRHSVTDKILATYRAGGPRPELEALVQAAGEAGEAAR